MYPDDSLTNIFTLDVSSGKWYDNYVVTPSRAGGAREEDGAGLYGGGFAFDLTTDGESLLAFPLSMKPHVKES